MFENKKEINDFIMELVTKKKMSVMDAALHISEQHGIEPDVIGDYIKKSPKLKALIRDEALKLNWRIE